MKTFAIGGIEETVVERTDVPPSELKKILGKETVAVIGYGTQGRGQALNLRDNGVKTVVAVRPGKSFELAKSDGWTPGKTLFSDIGEAVRKSTVVEYLLSDAGQKANWATIRDNLQDGAALYFSHGFLIVFRDQTGVVPPANVDVILVAPKGSGTTVRRLFLEGRGINASFAVEQDYTGRARERALALGIAVGAGYLFETTFRNEVLSDLTGERGVLMGAIYGVMRAQYQLLRKMGHTPSEAFNETVEEATQSLYPLIGENGMDWMYANCSTTAQRGALDWYRKFEEAVMPVFDELYEEVRSGRETAHVLDANSRSDYHQQLQKELAEVRNDEIWQIGAIVRDLRPERQGGSRTGSARTSAKKAAPAKPAKAGKSKPKAKPKTKKKAKARR
ncbi:MAG: ketol-acid reductoisomerase [Planctomycetota bacterium]|nr:ketol-acid reductoisomerase [Planctomycetota bacterium]